MVAVTEVVAGLGLVLGLVLLSLGLVHEAEVLVAVDLVLGLVLLGLSLVEEAGVLVADAEVLDAGALRLGLGLVPGALLGLGLGPGLVLLGLGLVLGALLGLGLVLAALGLNLGNVVGLGPGLILLGLGLGLGLVQAAEVLDADVLLRRTLLHGGVRRRSELPDVVVELHVGVLVRLGPGQVEVVEVVSNVLALAAVTGLEVADVVATVLALVTGLVAGLALAWLESPPMGSVFFLASESESVFLLVPPLVAQVLEVWVFRYWEVLCHRRGPSSAWVWLVGRSSLPDAPCPWPC